MVDWGSTSVSDEVAFTALYERWWEVVVAAALTELGDDDAAEDIAQVVFTRLWVSGGWRTIEQSAAYFAGAGRLEAQRLQACARRILELVDAPDPESDPLAHAWRGEIREAILEGLLSLPPRCRRVMNLSMCLGWSRREIAERMCVGLKAVEKQRARGLRLLRDWLMGSGGGAR